MNFLGIGPLEIVIILILAFLFFGPKNLPGMAAKAGNLYRNFRKATFDLTKTITDDMASEKDIRDDLAAIGKTLTEDITPKKDIDQKTQIPAAPESDNKSDETIAEDVKSTTKPVKKKRIRKKAARQVLYRRLSVKTRGGGERGGKADNS